MKDEIKEIFRRMNDLIEHQFDKEYHTECNLFGDIQRLLDYITNLEQKYERMKENANILSKGYDELEKRNEKAIEYINKYLPNYDFDKSNLNELLNILQGEDKDE